MRVVLLAVFDYFVQNASKRWFTAEMFASYRKSGSRNPFSVTDLLPGTGLMYINVQCDIIVTSHRKWRRSPEM